MSLEELQARNQLAELRKKIVDLESALAQEKILREDSIAELHLYESALAKEKAQHEAAGIEFTKVNQELLEENVEQARLLGISGNVETRLMEENKNLKEAIKKAIQGLGSPCMDYEPSISNEERKKIILIVSEILIQAMR